MPSGDSTPSHSVLIVDDSATARREVLAALAGNYDVAEAAHGGEAIALAKARRFDLVITDVNMPVMGGIELARIFRSMPDYADVPIFAVTTESGEDMVRRGRASGITAWVIKPVNPQLLARAVAKAVARSG